MLSEHPKRREPLKPSFVAACLAALVVSILASPTILAAASGAPAPAPASAAATCTDSFGPGIVGPGAAQTGLPGLHAAWWGQSGYGRMCPGSQATFTVGYLNTGSLGWYGGAMGKSAYLGTWGPEPGQDKPSPLGGDGTYGMPNTGWPAFDRVAVQPAPYVGPGQVAWFSFTLQAPMQPGWYRLGLRPLIEGAQWLEDQGVYWQLVVPNPDGTIPPAPVPVTAQSATAVVASYFGPGLYGNRTACGQTLTTTLLGVAHRTLPCGSAVTLVYGSRTVTVPVVDRGPYNYAREFDLTYATRNALGCNDVCTLTWLH